MLPALAPHRSLIAHALVPKTNSWFANVILWLPAAARAWLPMRLEFLPEGSPAAGAAPTGLVGASEADTTDAADGAIPRAGVPGAA